MLGWAMDAPGELPRNPLATRHLDRARAESFGAIAHDYDRLRPPYARAMIDDLLKLQPASALDVGCGTGKVAVALSERGLPVLGIEPDERMASLARARGIAVERATFEAWEAGERRFDLVTSGNAWHWVNPTLGFPKLATVLRPGGFFAMFFAVDLIDDAVAEAFAPVYRTHAPELAVFGDPKPARADVDPLAGIDLFSSIEKRIYPAERTLSGEGWAGLMATVSDHQRLPPQQLMVLQQGIREAIDRLGGRVRSQCATHLWLAQR